MALPQGQQNINAQLGLPINGGGSSGNQVNNEIPAGADGSVFTLAHAPSPASSLLLFRNGQLQKAGGVDFTLVGLTITFVGGLGVIVHTDLAASYSY